MPRTKAAGRKAKQKKAPKDDEPGTMPSAAASDDTPRDAAAAPVSPAKAAVTDEGSKNFSGEKRKNGNAEGSQDGEKTQLPPAEPKSDQAADEETPGWPADEASEEPKKKRKKTRSKMKNLKKDNRDDSKKPKYYKEGWNQQLKRSKQSSGDAASKHTSFF